MEDLEQRALIIFPNPPSIWVRYVDDVYAIMETEHIESFHKYLNTINSSIQFTKEIEASGSLAFLDVFLHREADGSFSTNVYRKSTHTGRYLPYTSHHPTTQKLSIARTLYSRADNITNKSKHKLAEFDYIYQTLKTMGFQDICALAINFLLSRLNLTLDLNRLTHTLLLSQFHMCREFLSLLREFWPKSALEWLWNHIVCCHLFFANLRTVLRSLKKVGLCMKFHVVIVMQFILGRLGVV